MNQPRLPWPRIAPKSYQAMASVNGSIGKSTLGPALMELVQTRASQINGCAFCLDMHARVLRKHGERWQRLNSLSTWRDVDFYDDRERAALNWTELLTRLPDHHLAHDAAFDTLRQHFSDQEIVELSWTIASINAWNRMAVAMRTPPSGEPLE